MNEFLFDTSILIAGFVSSHPKHHLAHAWLKRALAQEFSWAVAAHSLAECYAVLTRLPLTPKISPSTAKLLIEENVKRSAEIVSLSASDYYALIEELTASGLAGGIIYDAIIFKSAKKIQAKKIVTLNARDFYFFSSEDKEYIISI